MNLIHGLLFHFTCTSSITIQACLHCCGMSSLLWPGPHTLLVETTLTSNPGAVNTSLARVFATSAISPNSVMSFLSVGVIVTLTDSSGSTTSLYTTSAPFTVTSCQPKGYKNW
eukprot:GHRR01036566.1.p1 GENE.GHRR01036566.1~~GHRR01036566.1.p1  ORF type:complete len:113 (-),score=12.11 GHRR01036566.1:566-904(-)